MSDPAKIVEDRDALAHLSRKGFDRLLAALEDERSFAINGAAAGRPTLSGIATVMGLTTPEVLELLERARKTLER
jgi:hypothetical protein